MLYSRDIFQAIIYIQIFYLYCAVYGSVWMLAKDSSNISTEVSMLTFMPLMPVSFPFLSMLAKLPSALSSLFHQVYISFFLRFFKLSAMNLDVSPHWLMAFPFWKVTPWTSNPATTKKTESVRQIKLPCCVGATLSASHRESRCC